MSFTYKGTEYPTFEPPRRHLTPAERTAFNGYVIEQHNAGVPIRTICEATGRGYGTVHLVLKQAGAFIGGRTAGRGGRPGQRSL